MNYMRAPQEVIARRRQEYLDNVRKDMNAFPQPQDLRVPEGELLSNRDFPTTLGYIKAQAKSDDGVMFDLMARNREPENIEKAAEEVIKIIESQEFTVSEALLFLNYVEGMVLASPVSY